MSEFWIPAVRDPSSRDLQRGNAVSRRRQTLGTFASFRRVDRTQPFSGRVRKHFFVAERRHRRRHRHRRRLSHPCARASTTPDVHRARSTHWKIIASPSSSSSWLPVARCASNDEQKCNLLESPEGRSMGHDAKILGRCQRDRSMRLLTGNASRIRLGTQFPRRTVRGEPINHDARRPRPRPGGNADADGRTICNIEAQSRRRSLLWVLGRGAGHRSGSSAVQILQRGSWSPRGIHGGRVPDEKETQTNRTRIHSRDIIEKWKSR